MTKLLSGYIIFFAILLSKLDAQQNYCDLIVPADYLPYSHGLLYNCSYTQEETNPEQYKKETSYYYSSSIFLYRDSTFLYYCYTPTEYALTAGRYSNKENIITLSWDPGKTMKLLMILKSTASILSFLNQKHLRSNK